MRRSFKIDMIDLYHAIVMTLRRMSNKNEEFHKKSPMIAGLQRNVMNWWWVRDGIHHKK